MERYQQNDTVRIDVCALNSSNAGATGATVTLKIRRASDGWYWNGSAFQSGATTVNMTESDSSGMPGYYHYNFSTSGLADDEYTVFATSATASVVNEPFGDSFIVGGYVDNIASAASVADAVWDETASDHLTSGTFGYFFKRIRAYIANKVGITSNTYTVYDDNGSSTYATGTTTASDGTRTPS